MTRAAKSLWSGPCLYVPVHVDALMIGEDNRKNQFADVGMSYRNLILQPPRNPAPLPLVDATEKPAAGIYLQWTLPHSLRRGRQRGPDSDAADDPRHEDSVDFPFVPNRWLVTRFLVETAGQKPSVKAWVIESDAFNSKKSGSSTTYPNPDSRQTPVVGYLGAKHPLDSWAEVNALPLFLRAPGPGDLSWSAVFRNVDNVFALYDLPDTQGTCTYSVMGWYSQPEADPLYGAGGEPFISEEEWQALMHAQGWALSSDDEAFTATEDAMHAFQLWLREHPQTGAPEATEKQLQLASQTLCHGLVYGLSWEGTDHSYEIAPILDEGRPPAIAVGGNAAEAVAAFMAKQLSSSEGDVEDLLLAFQADQLTTWMEDPAQFAFACHENRFDRSTGGIVWTVVLPQSGEEHSGDGSQQILLDEKQTVALGELVEGQRQLETAIRRLASARWQLYADYWKVEKGAPVEDDYLNRRSKELDQFTKAVADLTEQRDAQKDKLEALLGNQFRLKPSAAPQFTRPTDPVVLVAAAGADTKLEEPEDIGTKLLTRFTGQTVGGILIDGANIIPEMGTVRLDAADLKIALSELDAAALPKETASLWMEGMLLDPGNSLWFAQLATAKAAVKKPTPAALKQLAERIEKQQSVIWSDRYLHASVVAEKAGFEPEVNGTALRVPSKLAVAKWRAPWTPLYLDWEIEWWPSAPSPQKMFAPWTLGEVDFTLSKPEMDEEAGERLTVRSLLTSAYPAVLHSKLSAFLDAHPDVSQRQELHEALKNLARPDLMVQSLTGLGEWLQSRRAEARPKISDSKIVEQTLGVPGLLADTNKDGHSQVYNPLRAGHFRIRKLEVVDAFGQVLSGQTGDGLVLPIRSKSLTPAGDFSKSTLQLTPRVSQGLRLLGTLVDRNDDKIASNSSDSTSPICGWLLPNHLNESLMVFDAEGESLGEIIRVETDRGRSLRWDAAPGKDQPLGSPPAIENRHLLGMVRSLLSQGTTGTQPLDELLDLIDVTLWSTDLLPANTGGNMTLLIGQPIALVRAAFQFELEGDPIYQQDWDLMGKQSDEGFPAVQIPFRVGDMRLSTNGSLGYYVTDDYKVCHAMYGYDPAMGSVRRTVRRPQVTNRTLMQHVSAARKLLGATLDASGYIRTGSELRLQCGGQDRVLVTLLADPRGVVTAASGTCPIHSVALPNGPVNAAMKNLRASFRMGPLLLQPQATTMPLPTGIAGKWSWIERTGVTFWREDGPVRQQDSQAQLPATLPTLREGWLSLSEALTAGKSGKEIA